MRKREIDVFGFLLGVVIGCLLGFFLSSRININNKEKTEPVISEKGNVHLLQIAKLEDAKDALDVMKDLSKKGLKVITVNKGNDNFYIYGGIAINSEDLAELEAKYLDAGYQSRIVKEYLLDKPNTVIESTEEFEFWTECIDNLLNSLESKPVEVSEKYIINWTNWGELPLIIMSLNENYDEAMLHGLKLDAYKLIVEKLG